jgi:hypothetical protein
MTINIIINADTTLGQLRAIKSLVSCLIVQSEPCQDWKDDAPVDKKSSTMFTKEEIKEALGIPRVTTTAELQREEHAVLSPAEIFKQKNTKKK